jgi:quinol monooxygenase YgiN
MKYKTLLAACIALGLASARAAEPGTAPPPGRLPEAAPVAGPVFVSAYVDVRPALARETGALVASYVHATGADAGNLEARALQEIDRAGKFVVVETWKDQASFADHEKAAHTQEFREKLKLISRIPYDQGVHHGLSVDPMPVKAGADALYVVTHVDVRSGREVTEGQLRQLAETTRSDPGHVRYDAYQQNAPRTNHFTLFAVWSGRKAYDAYGATAHWLQFVGAIAPTIGAPYDDRLYRQIK